MIRTCLKGLLVILPLAIFAFAAGGCGGGGNQTIATIGDYELTTEEFNEYFDRVRLTFASGQEEFNKKREFLDSMIVTRLLIQGAYEKNIDKMEELAKAIEANREKFLISALYKKHISSKAEPTEAEIRDYYNKLENRIRVYHILLNDPDTAQAVFERVKAGENFEQLAYEYSIDPNAKRDKGDLGYLLWGATVDEFQEAAFAMEPGEVSPPVKTRFGYHIIKMIDKQPNETRREFDQMKESIKNQLLRRKSMKLTEEYFKVAREKYPIAIDTATFEYLIHKREQVYPPQVLASLPKNDFDVEMLDRNEKELVVANWEGGQVSLIEYLTQLKNIPANLRPNLTDYDSLEATVFEIKKIDILTKEAIAEGLDNDEEYLRSMRMFKEFNMADIMKNDSIQPPPPPEEEDLRQYYEENIQDFTTPAKIHIHEIQLSDELKARKLAGQIKSLKDFQAKAAELTERPGMRSKKGDMGYIEEKWYPEIFAAAANTPAGRVGGPVMNRGKYSIFYVVDKIQPEIRDFLDVKKTIHDRLVKQGKNDAIQAWIDERLKSTEVDVNEEALWSTIDMDKYAGTEAEEEAPAGS